MRASLFFINDYLQFQKLTCHKGKDSDCEIDMKQLEQLMKSCSNNGKFDNSTGVCNCQNGAMGADCSVKPADISGAGKKEGKMKGLSWEYFRLPGGNGDKKLKFEFAFDQAVDFFFSM